METIYGLYIWNWSAFGCDTAFFYFTKKGLNCLVMVEYWADKETVAPRTQHYTFDGDVIEDEGEYLTDEETKYLTNICKNIIK